MGVLSVVSDGRAVTRVGWGMPAPADVQEGEDPLLADAIKQLTEYFAGTRRRFDLPLELGVQTEGARAVLTTLYETVEYGESVTYGQLAARSGSGIPARGIGAIMGANPIPIIVPCHRVLAEDGLGGYSGGEKGRGLETKRWLLEREGALPAPLF